MACPVVIVLAAPAPLAVSRAEGTSCPAPAIEAAREPGGLRQLSVRSPCRKNELVTGRYGDVVIMDRFDHGGSLVFMLDCFLGDREIELTFADNRRAATHACTPADGALTKVAIVWQDRVDLELHALEYAALSGSPWDRSAANPGAYQAAQMAFLQSGRSHGFMSSVSDGRQLGHNVEVYTLLRHPAEQHGLIAMAVGPGAKYDAALAGSCAGRHQPLRIDLDVYVLDGMKQLRTYERSFAAPCDGGSPRLATSLVPGILVGAEMTGHAP
jgi:hypothetical protein